MIEAGRAIGGRIGAGDLFARTARARFLRARVCALLCAFGAVAMTAGVAEAAQGARVDASTTRGCLKIAHSLALMQGWRGATIAGGRVSARREGLSLTVECPRPDRARVSVRGADAGAAMKAESAFAAALPNTHCMDDCN